MFNIFFIDSLVEARLKLNKATQRSDLSSTEDDILSMRSKKRAKFNSITPDHSKHVKYLKNNETFQISDSCPPRYTQLKGI